MHTLSRLRLRDLLMYREVDIRFTAPVYTVRGLNRDRKQRNAANAAGKTFLFATLPTVWYGAPPTSSRKNTAKSIHGKGSLIEITTRDNDGEKVVVSQASTGRSLKMEIKSKGRTYDYRELKRAKEHVERLIPATEDQYYAFNMIATRKFHPLLDGKADQRFKFFEGVFNMNMHDAVFERLSEIHSEMRVSVAALKRQEERYAQEKKDSEAEGHVNLKAAKVEKDSLSQASKAYSEKHTAAMRTAQAASTYLSVVGSDSTDGLDVKRIGNVLEGTEARRKYIKAQLSQARETEAKIEASADARRQRDKLKARLKSDFSTVDTGILTEKNERNVGLIGELRRAYTKAKEKRTLAMEAISRTPLKSMRDELGDDYIKGATKKKQEEAHRRMIVAASQLSRLNDVKVDEDGQCTICGSKVSKAHISEEKEKWSSKYNSARLSERALRRSLEYKQAKDDVFEAGEIGGRCFKRMERIEATVKKLDKLRYQMERAREKRSLEKELSKLIVHDIEPPKVSSKKLEERLEAVDDEIRELERRMRLAQAIASLDKSFDSAEAAREARKKARERVEKYAKLSEKTQSKLDKITTRIMEAEAARKSLRTLEQQIEADKKATRDFSVYEGLREAYGSRGIRLEQIEGYAKKYINNLNAIAHLMFSEPIEFSYRIAKNAFDILAQRNTRGGEAKDVSSLSGSEAGAFKALSVLALMPLLPSSKRFGFIIFDEIEANMDKPTRELLVREFLPVLTKVVPLVIFITPKTKSEFLVPRSRELLVTKKNGVATVTEG